MDTTSKNGKAPPGENGLNIVFVYADSPQEWNCSQWRCLAPSDAFNRAGGKWHGKLIHASGFVNFLLPEVQDWIMPADLVIFQRNIIDKIALDAIRYYQGMGKVVAIDLDDAYQILPWSNPAHRFWHVREAEWDGQQRAGAALKYLAEGLRLANALIAPNRNLLRDWGHICRGYYLQNYAETGWWLDLPDRAQLKQERGLQDRIVIGWGGSVSHYDSWWGSGLYEAARRVSRRHPEVVWLICGNDDRIIKDLPVPFDQKMTQAGVPASEWPRTVQSFDIGVAPLYGIYDQRRSWIKGMEYALAAVPWVGAAGEVYGDIADLGALVPEDADAWDRALEGKIANLKAEQAALKIRLEESRTRFLVDRNLHIFEAVYRKIIADAGQRNMLLPGVRRVNMEPVVQYG